MTAKSNKPLLSLAFQLLKILKEAEKQLQTLLCLPSTDRRISIKFMNCLLHLETVCVCVLAAFADQVVQLVPAVLVKSGHVSAIVRKHVAQFFKCKQIAKHESQQVPAHNRKRN